MVRATIAQRSADTVSSFMVIFSIFEQNRYKMNNNSLKTGQKKTNWIPFVEYFLFLFIISQKLQPPIVNAELLEHQHLYNVTYMFNWNVTLKILTHIFVSHACQTFITFLSFPTKTRIIASHLIWFPTYLISHTDWTSTEVLWTQLQNN